MKKLAVLAVFIFLIVTAYAQVPSREKINREGAGFNEFGNTDFQNMRDTTKVKGGLKNGKLLDDSTKQIYGPTTSKYTYAKNIKLSQHKYLNIDTLINDLHRFNFVNNWGNKLQNLGNIGTPATSMYYQLPDNIGVNSGYTIFDPYQRKISDIRFFDTHSPFSDIAYHNGGQGRGITEVAYSRNVNERWNIGFDFRGLFIDKQIGRKGKGDRHVTNTSYDIYTHYKSENDKYQGLFTFVRNMHRALETGGINVANDSIRSDFFADNAKVILGEAVSRELTRDYLLYQEYMFLKKVGVYYEFERNLRMNDFEDKLTEDEVISFYDRTRVSTTSTFDRQYFDAISNQLGIKGNIGNAFYGVYYKHRTYKVNYGYLDDFVGDVEEYGGFNLHYDFDSTFVVGGSGEQMATGEYRYNGYVNHPWVNASYTTADYKNGMKHRFFYGNHAYWINDFNTTQVNEIKANLNIKLKSFLLKPKFNLTHLDNYIYYDTAGLPQQSNDITILSYGNELHFTFFNKFHIKNEVLFTNVSGTSSNVIRVPEILLNGQIYYEDILFNGNLQIQAGVDATWKSAYYANAYNPAIQEFHLQNSFEIADFGLYDIFVNIKIGPGRVYLKYINLAQAIVNIGNDPDLGYFASPKYPGQRNGIDFGVKWAFYD